MALGIRQPRTYWIALFFVFCMIAFIFVLPQLFISYFGHTQQADFNSEHFTLGLENITQEFLQSISPTHDTSYKVALVTNQTGKDQMGNRNIDILLQKGLLIKKIFVPINSLDGPKIVGREKSIDVSTHIPVVHLQGKLLKVEDLKGIDVIFFDIQDVGIRYCSSLGLLINILEIAGRLGKIVVVLDRPNLLGDVMEGAFTTQNIEQSLLSVSVPIRYGMTIGELAQYCNKYLLKKAAHVYVAPMNHYNRHRYPYDAPVGNLSPNINSIESCHGYSFLGLLGEVWPFDIGIGTDKAFQCILLPEHIPFSKKQWFRLKEQLNDLGIDSKSYSYYSFRKKEVCIGLRVCIRDISNFSLFKALVSTLEFFKNEGVPLKFSKTFSTIAGMHKVKELIDGTIKHEEFAAERKYELEHFFVMASSSFIYKPYPKLLVI